MTAALSTSRLRSVDLDQARFLTRWLRVWIVLLTVVTLVVVVYLIVITDSLANINGNLGTASAAVTGAGGHVQTLPNQIQTVNGSLTSIDSALKPITGEADQIVSALTSINNSAQTVDGSLKNTSASLVTTSSSLQDTSSVLTSVLGVANNINGTLVSADHPQGDCGNGTACRPNQLGVQNIWQRVTNINPVLGSARGDTSNAAGTALPGVNRMLSAICSGPVVTGVSSNPILALATGGKPGPC